MNTNRSLIATLLFVLALSAAPVFAQRVGAGGGLGAGVGLGGGQTRVGGGGGVGTQVGNTGVGARTGADVQTNTQVKAGAGSQAGANSQASGGGVIATRIESNPELSSRVQAMLPSGMSMAQASSGFKNEGQFLAALHASNNLNIPFDQLKANMTGSSSMSLGSAIKAAKPSMTEHEAKEEAKKAEHQAKEKIDAHAHADAAAHATAKASGKQ